MKLISVFFISLVVLFNSSAMAEDKYNCSELKFSSDKNKCIKANKGKDGNYDHGKYVKKNSSASNSNLKGSVKESVKESGKKIHGSISNLNEKYKKFREKIPSTLLNN